MKKLILIALLVMGATVSFSTQATPDNNYAPYALDISRNPNREKLVFAATAKNGKIITIYKEGKNLIYTYGNEGKPEIVITGVPGENLFTHYDGSYGNRHSLEYISFGNADYRYVIGREHESLYNSETEGVLFDTNYILQVYNGNKLITVKKIGGTSGEYKGDQLTSFESSVIDNDLFKELFDDIPRGNNLKYSTKGFSVDF